MCGVAILVLGVPAELDRVVKGSRYVERSFEANGTDDLGSRECSVAHLRTDRLRSLTPFTSLFSGKRHYDVGIFSVIWRPFLIAP